MEETIKKRDWVPKYIEHIIAGNFEASNGLKNNYLPQSLFKYKALNKNTFDNLNQKTFWLSTISSLNDPFECSLQFDNDACFRLNFGSKVFRENFKKYTNIELSEKEISELTTSEKPHLAYIKLCKSKGLDGMSTTTELTEKIEKQSAEIIEEMNENMKVCCFSERNDSLLMWSHYAEEHKGICIEYDLANEDHIRPWLQAILYSDAIYKIDTYEDLNIRSHIASALIKSKDWAYEEEWRITIWRRNNFLPETLTAPKPKAIYLGTRFSLNKNEEIKQLKKISKEQDIPLYQMGKHSTEYKLVKIH